MFKILGTEEGHNAILEHWISERGFLPERPEGWKKKFEK